MITEIVILLEVTEAQKIVLNDKMIHIVKSLRRELGDRPTDPIYMCVPGTLKDSFDASFSNFVRKKRTYVRHCKHCSKLGGPTLIRDSVCTLSTQPMSLTE